MCSVGVVSALAPLDLPVLMFFEISRLRHLAGDTTRGT